MFQMQPKYRYTNILTHILTSLRGPSCPYFHWHMWALTDLEDGHQGSLTGSQSSAGAAAPSRYRDGRDHSQSWLNPSADPEPLGWCCRIFGMDLAWAETSGCGQAGQRRTTEMEPAAPLVLLPFFCFPPVGLWCRCNICCTSSRLYGGSSLLWCTLCMDWSETDCNHNYHKQKISISANNKTHMTINFLNLDLRLINVHSWL